MIARRTFITGSLSQFLPMLPAIARAAEVLQDVKLAVSSTSFVLGGVKIGEQAGLFTRNGLALKIVVMESGNAALAATISGSVPFSVAGPPDVLTARARGQDLVIVASLYAGFAGSVVLGKSVADKLGVVPTAPVKERLRALDGLLLAVPSATSVLVAPVREGAAESGAKVRLVYMAQGAMSAALETNAIQGMIASYPFAGTPVLRGTGVLWISGPGGEFPADVAPASSSTVQATSAFVKSNAETVRRLQQSLIAIAGFIESEPGAAKRALAAGYPDLAQQDVDLAFQQQWKNWTKPFLTEADMRQELKLLIASTHAPGLERLDPASALAGRM
jgi:ABC-type nitrate/sulfonate/bicarbonate transport system substrate-binding protein